MNNLALGFLVYAQLITYPAININKLADAIFRTEGSYGTSWPTGTINHYKYDTTRQDCLNIIRHQIKLWDGHGDFIDFLGKVYSPLNKYWTQSVKYFYYPNSRLNKTK